MAELKDKVVTLECLKAVHEKDAQTIEQTQEELTATKEELSNTKTALATTQEDLKKAQRAIQFQSELNKGQTWDFEEDDQEAYQRQVPSGAKAGAVMEVGGKTVAWNQLVDDSLIRNRKDSQNGILFEKLSAQSFRLSGTATDSGSHVADFYFSADNSLPCVSGHKYLVIGGSTTCNVSIYGDITHAVQDAAESFIETATKTGSSVKFWARLPITDGQTYDLVVKIAFVDLTLLYGPGNEPTDTTDPRIAQIEAYAAAHPEYNAGELVSAEVDSVVEKGANLISIQALQAWWPNDTEVIGDILYAKKNSGGANGIVDKRFPISIPSGAVISAKGVKPQSNMVMSPKARLSFVLANGQILECFLSDGSHTPKEVENVVASNDIIAVYLDYATTDGLFGIANLMIRLPYASSTYSPYHQTTYPIPDAVKQLPGYGRSAGSVANTIERTEDGWRYVQRVGSVDLGTLRFESYAHPDGFSFFYTNSLHGHIQNNVHNGACDVYTVVEDISTSTNMCIAPYWPYMGSGNDVCIRDDSVDNVDDLIAKISGKILYFVLATPIITDITALMGDALAPFVAEAGGSITLHHPKADDGYEIDVPGKVQYITKLSEVETNG